MGRDESGAGAGALHSSDCDGRRKDNPAANFDWKAVGTAGEEVLIAKGEPMRRNSMTEKSCVVADERDFVVERQRLRDAIDSFAAGGQEICTKHPHFFFGPLTPVEWAALMHQHLDHHLRQFGV